MTGVEPGDDQSFWQSGQNTVSGELLPLMERYAVNSGCAVEVGCGIGRLAIPMAGHVQKMMGIDVAPAMVRQAQHVAEERSVNNIRFLAFALPAKAPDELKDLFGRTDFLYSLLVFQHVEDFGVIEGFISLTRSLLSPSGIAYLQFDTRPKTLPYRLKTALPDFVLPWFLRRGIRRIRRRPAELENCFARNELSIAEERTPRSAYHCYLLRRPKEGNGD